MAMKIGSKYKFSEVHVRHWDQFAQSVGLIFALVAITGSITGISGLFVVAVSFALAAAFLNAAFNFCLGCEMYLLLLRARKPQAS